MSPSPDDVRAQLERVLASDVFANAGRHSRLVRYLVERTLAGEGEQLKEYVLGTEVFDRADSYDPRIDSIVRVEARRLRNRLEDYYRGAGSRDPVVISIPRGSYVPTFQSREDAAPVAHEPAGAVAGIETSGRAPAVEKTPGRSPVILVAAAALILLVVGAISQIGPGRTPAAQASTGPAIAVLPFQHYSIDESDAMLAARLTDAVTTELARLRSLAVASRTSASQFTGETRSVGDVRKALNVDFVMEATAVNAGESIHVTIRVVDATRDRKVWVGEYSVAPRDIPVAARRIAAEASDGTLKYHARTSPSPSSSR
jgi:TolB-like protein